MSSNKINKITKLKIVIYILILLVLVSYFYFGITRGIINIIIFSVIIAWILDPLKNRIAQINIMNEKKASLIIILFLVAFAIAIFILIIPSLYREIDSITEVVEKIYSYVDMFENNSKVKNSDVLQYFYELFKIKSSEVVESLSKKVVDNILSFSENIMSLAVIPVVTYYFLSEKKYIYNKIYKLIPLNKRRVVKKIIKDSNELLLRYINGQLYLSILISLLTLIILLIFKVKFPLWLSLMNGIFNIIPYFGPILGGVPIIIVALLDSSSKGIWVAISIIIIQQIEGNILAPKITGDSINMHPLIIIILLILGEEIAGFLGMLFVVPIAVIIKVVYEDINYYLF